MNVIGVHSTVCGLYMHLNRPLLDLLAFALILQGAGLRGLSSSCNVRFPHCVCFTLHSALTSHTADTQC